MPLRVMAKTNDREFLHRSGPATLKAVWLVIHPQSNTSLNLSASSYLSMILHWRPHRLAKILIDNIREEEQGQ